MGVSAVPLGAVVAVVFTVAGVAGMVVASVFVPVVASVFVPVVASVVVPVVAVVGGGVRVAVVEVVAGVRGRDDGRRLPK